tara:strand:- start:211 stop:387 length:177 start_codon:yes stop_codon:yes gene_type:complete
MKNLLVGLSLMAAVCSLSLAGCGGHEPAVVEKTEVQQTEQQNYADAQKKANEASKSQR